MDRKMNAKIISRLLLLISECKMNICELIDNYGYFVCNNSKFESFIIIIMYIKTLSFTIKKCFCIGLEIFAALYI